jgi:hypothetical protein
VSTTFWKNLARWVTAAVLLTFAIGCAPEYEEEGVEEGEAIEEGVGEEELGEEEEVEEEVEEGGE